MWFFSYTNSNEDPELRTGWPVKYGLVGGDFTGYWYISGFYWAFTTITTTGYGDIIPANNTERIVALLCSMFGTLVFGHVAGSMAALAQKSGIAKGRMNNRTREMKAYMKKKRVTKALKKKSLKYLRAFYDNTHGRTSLNEELIIAELPLPLRDELLIFIHRNAINKLPMLSRYGQNFMTYILRLLRPTFVVGLLLWIFRLPFSCVGADGRR